MKTCTKCNIEKPISEFGKAKGYKGGHYTWCKKCRYINTRRWLKSNPKNIKHANEAAKSWYEKQGKEYHRNWREQNRKKVRLANRKYAEENREKRKEYKRQRRFAYLDTDITLTWLKELRDATTHCPICQIELTVDKSTDPTHGDLDHKIPFAKGGKHIQSNVWYICHSCNLRKGTAFLEDFTSL